MDNKVFWEQQATLGSESGTRDRIAKQLEIQAIAKHVKDGMHVLDLGCGDGETLLELCRRYEIQVVGADRSESMIRAATHNAGIATAEGLKSGQPRFYRGPFDVLDIPELLASERFDLCYTERVLINLANWEEQAQAIRNIVSLLKPGGLAVFCECSQDGLDRINELRVQVGLKSISPAWHNLYLTEGRMCDLLATLDGCLEWTWADYFASTYAYHSRVVNAYLAKQEGRDPSYDAPVNAMALKLPPMFGYMGQNAIWTWRKAG